MEMSASYTQQLSCPQRIFIVLYTATTTENDVTSLLCVHIDIYRSPVKKKNLVQNERALTPKQRMEMRKKQKADQEAEDRKRLAARNFSEGQRRFREQKKRHARVIPPWVEEHPEVFKDAEFSITQTATDSSVYFDPQRGGGDTVSSSVMEMSATGGQPVWMREDEEQGGGFREHNQVAWVSNFYLLSYYPKVDR